MLAPGVERFIPAPAGNAWLIPSPHLAPPVHPRACGERRIAVSTSMPVIGSSPRLRGTLMFRLPLFVGQRFIPAPAGNASAVAIHVPGSTVHPRACGEREHRSFAFLTGFGSSPRLRGTRLSVWLPVCASRFIPAPAGNARTPSPWTRTSPVHPRACGERSAPWLKSSMITGSSPRLRGTPVTFGAGVAWDRFIPAPAGNAMFAIP